MVLGLFFFLGGGAFGVWKNKGAVGGEMFFAVSVDRNKNPRSN